MKKIGKVIIFIIVFIVITFILLGMLGSKDIAKEKKIASGEINEPVAVSISLADLATKSGDEIESLCLNKHIEINGRVSECSSNKIILEENNFLVQCYTTTKNTTIKVGMIVTINGVCTYTFSDKLRMRLCAITNVKYEDEQMNKDDSEKVVVEDTVKDKDKEDSEESKKEDKNVDTDNNVLEEKKSETDIIQDMEKMVGDACGSDNFKEANIDSGTMELKVYFERKSTLFGTDKLKQSVLETTYKTLQAYNTYMMENEDAPRMIRVIAYFPNDGKKNADEDCFMSICSDTELKEFNFTADDFSQVELYSYSSKWMISIE